MTPTKREATGVHPERSVNDTRARHLADLCAHKQQLVAKEARLRAECQVERATLIALIAVCIDDGVSKAEIGRTIGVSRQRVDELLQIASRTSSDELRL
jgi:hypothetical protein